MTCANSLPTAYKRLHEKHRASESSRCKDHCLVPNATRERVGGIFCMENELPSPSALETIVSRGKRLGSSFFFVSSETCPIHAEQFSDVLTIGKERKRKVSFSQPIFRAFSFFFLFEVSTDVFAGNRKGSVLFPIFLFFFRLFTTRSLASTASKRHQHQPWHSRQM